MKFSVLDFFKFASRMPQIEQILVSTFKIFPGASPPPSPRRFPPFVSLAILGSVTFLFTGMMSGGTHVTCCIPVPPLVLNHVLCSHKHKHNECLFVSFCEVICLTEFRINVIVNDDLRRAMTRLKSNEVYMVLFVSMISFSCEWSSLLWHSFTRAVCVCVYGVYICVCMVCVCVCICVCM